jgi:DNA-binding transcriptional regulator YdaS (Cro superfamily)
MGLNNMQFENVFKWFGGKKRTADAVGVTPAAVSQWIEWGYIPPANALKIELLTQGQFKAVDLINKG